MSYGWLTESSLLPKKQVKIDVESKTFVDLKVNLLKEKEKLKRKDDNKNKNTYTNRSCIKTKLNFKNVHDNKNDREQIDAKVESIEMNEPEYADYDRIKDQLVKKELLYEKLQKSNWKDLEHDDKLVELKESCMVDFEYKKVEEKRKKKFNKIESDKEKYLNNNRANTDESLDLNQTKEKVLVKQSYDKVLTQTEKAALSYIIEEETDYKTKLELLKRKKESEREERLERIKKMRIEGDSK